MLNAMTRSCVPPYKVGVQMGSLIFVMWGLGGEGVEEGGPS